MRIILGTSFDGYVARRVGDDMCWLGRTDKSIFRMLTNVGGTLGASCPTADTMPTELPGRKLIRLSSNHERGDMDLLTFHNHYPDGWLVGGPELCLVALRYGLVSQAFMCRSSASAFTALNIDQVSEGIKDKVTPYLEMHSEPGLFSQGLSHWKLSQSVPIFDVTVDVWTKERAF